MPPAPAIKKRRGGNPPFVATVEQRQMVMILAASGHRQSVIATRLGVSVDTLQRHLRTELDEGRDFANSTLGERLYKHALAGDVLALREWFDRRGGPEWRKRTASEQSGPNGGPIRVSAEPPRRDLSTFTEDELELYERLTAKLEADATASN